MGFAEKKLLRQLSGRLAKLYAEMLALDAALIDDGVPLQKEHRRSAHNLAHYLALRQQDLRELQTSLAALGLSSLGRSESHVLSAIETVYHVLIALLGAEGELGAPSDAPVKLGEGTALLDRNAAALLGRKPGGARGEDHGDDAK